MVGCEVNQLCLFFALCCVTGDSLATLLANLSTALCCELSTRQHVHIALLSCPAVHAGA